ncbi:MAG: hypothetical protein IGS49_14320 [Chlorogloeopsis fritschii C42_A2020_084]|uniref:hypothetical protein n=1 Tax=Chlorogloeopsis fritschii TaxID=1124 RepID=UPI001A0A5A74|nr:hypothetical protein [Chlorogloeopsis fritschii]MBF2006601.1 hypothetical protein [Chlorogloeopsis fritschii C42_A2020_084]
MLHHISIAVENPQHVAEVLAELWVENTILLELLTPEMAARYVAFSTPENWEKLVLAATPV